MNKVNPPAPIRVADYEAIEAALMESARGRWFLAEFARRNRSSDTNVLLDAITRLETVVMRERTPTPGSDVIRRDLIEMSEAIARTRREIAAIRPPEGLPGGEGRGLVSATEELDAIVEATETATSDILGAAEEIQETAWQLREKGVDEAACDRLDQRATDIYTACSFQDITGQRTSKVVQILRYLEARVNAMVDIWGLDEIMVRDDPADDARPDSHLLNGPQLKGRGLEQNAIDHMIEGEDLFDDVAIADDRVAIGRSEATPMQTGDYAAGCDIICVDDAESDDEPASAEQTPARSGSGVVDAADFGEPEPVTVETLGRDKAEAIFG